MKSRYLLSAAAFALVAACGQSDTPAEDNAAAEAETQQQAETTDGAGEQQVADASADLGEWGVDLEAMDTSADPGDDFYEYVNGEWLETTEIPADKTNYGSFTALADEAEQQVREIIQDASATDAAPGSAEQKIGDLYNSWMDQEAIEARGLEPAQADLDRIAGLSSHEEIAAAMGDPALGAPAPYAGYVDIDSKQTDRYVFYITQSGLGLPDRDYYLNDDQRFQDIRAAYVDYIEQVFTMAGMEGGAEKAQAILELETAMAENSWERAKRRDRSLTYNLMTLDELKDYAPGFDWDATFEAAGLSDQDEFVVRENDAIQKLSATFADTPVETWKDYLTFHYIDGNANALPKQFDDANFAFYGKTLSGQPEQRERWKRGVSVVNGTIGEAVGKVYVEQHFPPEAKAQMEELVENLRIAFERRLDNGVEWMGAETKEEARAKLAAFTPKIAYPDEFETYDGLEVVEDDYYGNRRRAQVWGWNDMISKLGQPIDRGEWFMTPQTVNAYYSPNRNEIVFPAAILQAPFFDPNADPAVNYGGIGAVIGHEMGHGFDDQGRKSDGTGTLRDWWTEEDNERFEALAGSFGEQYAAYEPIEGYTLNPELTMGENIGDLGGMNLAYEAYKISLEGEEAPVLDGFSGDQRFFMAWGQVWQRLYRDEELINRIKTDPHSPSEFRVNGVVRNMDEWYAAFDVSEEDALYLPPEERVKIW